MSSSELVKSDTYTTESSVQAELMLLNDKISSIESEISKKQDF